MKRAPDLAIECVDAIDMMVRRTNVDDDDVNVHQLSVAIVAAVGIETIRCLCEQGKKGKGAVLLMAKRLGDRFADLIFSLCFSLS